MSEREGGGELLDVRFEGKPAAVGAALRVGAGLPAVLARLMPGTALRLAARQQIGAGILRRLSEQQVLSAGDMEFLAATLGDAEVKWVRKRQIAVRAAARLEAKGLLANGSVADESVPGSAASEGQASESRDSTSSDWISKYWADAELVDDELVQEVYGRLLAEEAERPRSFSLRTLGVLRYMDRDSAHAFGELCRAVFDRGWIPKPDELLVEAGVGFPSIVGLDDAGLVDSNGFLTMTYKGPGSRIRHGPFVAFVVHDAPLVFQAYRLSRAGSELSRVAEVEYSQTFFHSVLRWLTSIRKAQVRHVMWARIPSVDWNGDESVLEWRTLPGGPVDRTLVEFEVEES